MSCENPLGASDRDDEGSTTARPTARLANGDTNSADVDEGLELDAALSDELLASLAETLPPNASF